LTGMPGKRRASGDEALLFLGDIRERLTIVALDEQEYFRVAEASAAGGLAGGAIYDAILGYCALKAKAETIYTWNPRDFLRLSPAIASRVKKPGPR
jgi:predicted nucleic acid-binding protein